MAETPIDPEPAAGDPTDGSVERRDPRTLVTLLTGFLGSGKTTLLNRAMADPAMARTVVVINEFGEVGIDHALTTASDDTIVVLENGCLCCTVFGDLVGAMNRLYHAREAGELVAFDHVIIETSGLADPAPVLQAFLSEPTLAGLYRVGAVITTVDAVNGPATLDDHSESVSQVALADHIVVTKLDMIAEDQVESCRAALVSRLRRINRTAAISPAGDSALDHVELLKTADSDPARGGQATLSWLKADAYLAAPQAHDHGAHRHDHGEADPGAGHHHDESIAAFCLVRDEPSSREALELLLGAIERNLGPDLLRVKGLVNVTESPGRPAVIQGAQHLLHNLTWLDRWPSADERTRIVFISHNIAPAALEDMVSLLDRVAMRTSAARERGRAAREMNET